MDDVHLLISTTWRGYAISCYADCPEMQLRKDGKMWHDQNDPDLGLSEDDINSMWDAWQAERKRILDIWRKPEEAK